MTKATNVYQFRFLPVITGLFVGVLLLSNILASKMIRLGPFVFDGGTLLFPLSYLFGDVLTEVYGYRQTRKVIWTGLITLVLMSLNIWLIGILPGEASWPFQQDYINILMQMPRIVLASSLAYFVGEYVNSVVLSRMKIATAGKHLWMRTIASTLAGQLLDTAIFVAVAFAGNYPNSILLVMIGSNYAFKTLIEAACTPLTYAAVKFMKNQEQCDVFDHGVSYNPLPGGR
ncbi:MAG TPA: queuosine precursor transporter [Treponema sp.]|nr:queuosine precursor transporter [Treponema sp.]